MRLTRTGAPLLPAGPARVETVPGWIDPIRALALVRSRRSPALLYSGLADRHPEARHSILAWDPVAEIAVRGAEISVTSAGTGEAKPWRLETADPFAALRGLLPPTQSPGGLPFAGGAIGYLGYGLRGAVERLDRGRPEPLDLPDAWFAVYDSALLFDHAARTLRSVRLPGSDDPARAEMLRRMVAAAAGGRPDTVGAAAGGTPSRAVAAAVPRVARTGTPRSAYEAAVRDVLGRIARGDLYQVNLSHRISAPLAAAPFELFERLMRDNPAPFSAWLDAGDWQILSASPERFVELRGDVARSSPIKGTRPRGAFPEEDLLHADDLRTSVKDRAENVMIADLVRNDLGRVCRPGSVVVEALCRLESFATVHHLVTTVRGRLLPDRDRFDLLRALFPGGSMTGAPKVAAMQAIAALEEEERGPYSGAIGFLSCDGSCDFNIVIRTLFCGGGRAHVRVGGGIVADSDPEREWLETLDKARALLDVLDARLDREAI
ncbi:MAG TPA: aminodeoxychorismate synthase component I [Verrucomicrobiae bacterium]|nr:aminodeoxychorismate synthase component I [Verrucomicrobiae bacterium]